ncbi:hypothetical protein K445DRAFT_51281 [Daldinia sp. EC12]|nr:hypothetical protein K445DRAFT_51281 [Daldinia sp. EC12]
MHFMSAEHKESVVEHVIQIRTELDKTGLGQRLMTYWRSKESEYNGKYRVIIVGALLMRTGAKIEESDMQHLRELVPQVKCHCHTILPTCDQGFCRPGRAQFLAALDNYKPGEPRSFEEPSCYSCGKIEADLGKALMRCGHCKGIWYCDKECQKAHWEIHKPTCRVLGKFSSWWA